MKDYPHGTRARYVLNRCRCLPCTDANRDYYHESKERRLEAPLWADAETRREVVAHLRWLRGHNIGRRQIEEISGVARSTLAKIGGRRLKQATADKILGVRVDQAAPKALVDASTTWRLIAEMLSAGATRTRIAKELGSRAKMPALQLRRDYVTKGSADAVQRLHDAFFRGSVRMREVCRCDLSGAA